MVDEHLTGRRSVGRRCGVMAFELWREACRVRGLWWNAVSWLDRFGAARYGRLDAAP
jgi:hypothetical protein